MSPIGGASASWRSGPGDKADRFIFGNCDAPSPDRQALQAGEQGLCFTTGEPVSFQQRQLVAHHLQGDFHQQQAGIPSGPLQRAFLAALPESQQQFQGEGAAVSAGIGGIGGSGSLGFAGEWQGALA